RRGGECRSSTGSPRLADRHVVMMTDAAPGSKRFRITRGARLTRCSVVSDHAATGGGEGRGHFFQQAESKRPSTSAAAGGFRLPKDQRTVPYGKTLSLLVEAWL